MKHSMKYLGALIMTAAVSVSCVDNELPGFTVDKPTSIAQYEYLNDYDALKSYIDRSANPNFKLGLALTASEYNNQGLLYRLANANFDEIVAGNAMKYASVVGDDGSMNFGTVTSFINTAKTAGMSIYGHTLAWHSQQNNKYLNKLIADKEMETDVMEKQLVFERDFEDGQPINGWGGSHTREVRAEGPDGSNCMVITNPVAGNSWECQAAVDMAFDPGKTYVLSMKIKGSVDGSITAGFQRTSDYAGGGDFPALVFTTEWTEIEVRTTASEIDVIDRFLFSFGAFEGSIYIDDLRLYKEVAPAVEVEQELYVHTYQDGPFPYYQMGSAPDVINGAIHYVPNGSWNQFFCTSAYSLEPGDYCIYLDITSDQDCSSGIQLTFQNGWDATSQSVTANISVKAGRQTVRMSFPDLAGGNYEAILKPQTAPATLDLHSVTICQVIKMNTIPLTPEEKKAALVPALENWIAGMMAATEGYVTAWDAVNEAISGVDADGDGYYDLQSASNANGDAKNNFYWQDYLGNEEYVPIVTQTAEKYFVEAGGNASDLKLFINDYNLESDWDDNKKLKSLIHWIEVWEANGARIDGIGTQMHISCYANEGTQNSKKEHITKMFELMAATGKLVKVSELDMGYVDASGNSVKTVDMTFAQHQEMAELYKFVVSEYFRLIPAAQRYSITQWCTTDAPADSGWRGGEPVGLWDLNYNRKPAYGGFADGLAGK